RPPARFARPRRLGGIPATRTPSLASAKPQPRMPWAESSSARADGSATDGTYVGAPLAQRANARRSPRKSWTREARPLTSVPGGGVPAQARLGRAKRAGWQGGGQGPTAERRFLRFPLFARRIRDSP